MDSTTGRWEIKALLNTGVQPFDDVDDVTLKAIGKGIGNSDLVVPVVIGEDGILIDGHQRLKAMLKAGRTFITAKDVRVMDGVTAVNALEAAIALNVARRHLTVAEKAAVAAKLKKQNGWSQGKIARVFGVSRPAVSQWFAKHPAGDELAVVEGADGKTYPADKPKAKPTKPKAKVVIAPWVPEGGFLIDDIVTLTHRMTAWEPSPANPAGLTPDETIVVREHLGDLIHVAEQCLDAFGGEAGTEA